jgi:hypothetical protein
MGVLLEVLMAVANVLSFAIVCPLWVIFTLVRVAAHVVMATLHMDASVEFLRGLDAGFVYKHLDRPGNRLNFCSFAIVEGRPDPAIVRNRVRDNLIGVKSKKNADRSRAKRLTQFVQRRLGYFVWAEEANFALEQHVRFATCTAPCEYIYSILC